MRRNRYALMALHVGADNGVLVLVACCGNLVAAESWLTQRKYANKESETETFTLMMHEYKNKTSRKRTSIIAITA
jgi:hypothetical protein